MLDGQLQAIIHSTLLAGVAARGVAIQKVTQNNQPRQFVAPSVPTIFHTAGPRKNYGWPKYDDVLNEETGVFETIKTQVLHSEFQIAGCAPNPSPGAPFALTSGDLATIANSIFTDETNIAAFVAAGCNVFRVTDNPLIWFQDSSGQNVAWVSFDIIFTHKDVYTTSTGVITDFKSGIYRV